MKRAIPGIVEVTRYQAGDGGGEGAPQSLAIYELKDEKALQDFLTLRDRQQSGEIHAFTAGPPFNVIWRKAYKPV